MKKQLLPFLILSMLSVNTIFGQFKLDATGANDMRLRTSGADRVNILTNGNVGIGTISPNTKLHVIGDDNDGTTATLKISNGAQNMLLDGNEIDVVGGGLFLNYNSSGNINLANGGGNVGIGTSNPASKFHVSSGSSGVTPNAQTKYFLEDNSNNYLMIASPDASETGISFAKPGSGANILHSVGGGLSFRTNSNPRMTLTNGGNVGVGTTTPDTKLHVIGDENDGTTTALKITSGAQNMLLDGNEIDALISGLFLNNNSSGNVNLANGGGNVGVGTITPDTKLHVEGTVDNNGTTAIFKVTNTSGSSMLFDGNEIDGASNGPIYLNNNSTGGVFVGANGTGLKEIIKVTVNIPGFTVAANNCLNQIISVTNAAVDSAVSTSPDTGFATGLFIAYSRVSSAGNVLIRVCNFTGASIAQGSSDFHVAVVR